MRAFGEGLHVAEGRVRFYGFRLRTRMAAVALAEGRLLLYSPVPWTPELDRQLAALGRVAFLLAPNKIHNQTLAEWCRRHPDAELHAPPGLPERRADLPVKAVLGDEVPAAWRDELDLALTRGNVFLSEALLLHRRSRTLLCGDLVENLDASTASPLGRAAARAFGVGSHPVASPEHRLYTHDADSAARAFERVQAWDFGRIFLCHGGLVTRDAKEVFDEVTEGVLSAARRRSRASRWLLRRLAALQ